MGKWRGFILLQAMKKTIQSVVALSALSSALLSGCGAQTEVTTPEVTTPEATLAPETIVSPETTTVPVTESTEPKTRPSTSTTPELSYKNGTYTKTGSYASPAGMDTIGVTLVVENDIVKSVSIDKQATNEGSVYWQNMFADGISSLVVGKSLDSIGNLSAVNGASLTPKGFNQALSAIKAEAQA